MYRQIIIPNKKNRSIELPEEFFGKKVEVIAFEVKEEVYVKSQNRQTSKNFLNDIEPIPDFPSIEEIRKDAWPERW